MTLLTPDEWAEVGIVSKVDVVPDSWLAQNPSATLGDALMGTLAPGTKCARCWRVLPEVGTVAAHPALCLRCADAVESGLVCRAAAE